MQSKFGLEYRLVEISDAPFVTSLRNDKELTKHLHQVSGGVSEQVEWLTAYKEREKRGEEYYFIFFKDGEPVGLNRIYNITEDSFTTGSWLFRKDCDFDCAIKGSLIVRDFAYEKFPDKKFHFDVRKDNKTVLKYHKIYNPTFLYETDLDYFFELSREAYAEGRKKVLKALNIEQ